MRPRMVFLVMSAVSKPETVDQLARSLAPHVALVHHDHSQTPHFPLAAPNVQFVPHPRRTGWAYFGFVDGIFHSLRHALAHLEFDYLQLLSPTCLPIKPMPRLEAWVEQGAPAHFDAIDVLADHDALMSVGYRAFTPKDSWRHRVARRATDLYYSQSQGRRDEAGVWLHTGADRGWRTWPAALLMAGLKHPSIGRHPFGQDLRPYYGSAWFGARREIVEGMVAFFDRPGVRDYFSRLCIAEEFLFPTMLMQLTSTHGPMNHVLQRYHGAHPGFFGEDDLPMLREAPAFFARKFPDDPSAPVRARVLRELLGTADVVPAEAGAARPQPGAQERPAAVKPEVRIPQPATLERLVGCAGIAGGGLARCANDATSRDGGALGR